MRSSPRPAPPSATATGASRLEGQIAALTTDPALAGRRLRRAADEGPRSLRHGLGRLALLAGMVAPRAVAHQHAGRHDVRAGVAGVPQTVQRRRERLHPPGAHVAAPRCRDDRGVRRRVPSARCGRSRRACLYMPSETDLVFPARRCALRAGVHPAGDVHAHPVVMGTLPRAPPAMLPT